MSAEPSTADVEWKPDDSFAGVATSPTEGLGGRYRALISRCPVAHIPASGIEGGTVDYWAVLGFDELARSARDFKTFSSIYKESGPRILPLQSDPPEHAFYRRPLNRYFDAEAMSAKEKEVEPIAVEMIEAMVDAGEAEFLDAFAYPFPIRTLCRFLGVSDEDWEMHHEWVMDMERVTGGGVANDEEAIPPELAMRIMPYIQKVVAARRAEPLDDIVTGMTEMEVEGRRLDDMEVGFLMMTFIMAGHFTTTAGLGNLVQRLAVDPELQSFLRANPDRIPDAVEESLRIDAPQQAMPRRCVQDVELGGQTIKAGDSVLFNFGSANLDPAHWENPEVFDVDREDKRHVGFGRGIHRCIGAPLARMEMALVTRELLARTSSFEIAGPVKRSVWPRLAPLELPLGLKPAV